MIEPTLICQSYKSIWAVIWPLTQSFQLLSLSTACPFLAANKFGGVSENGIVKCMKKNENLMQQRDIQVKLAVISPSA